MPYFPLWFIGLQLSADRRACIMCCYIQEGWLQWQAHSLSSQPPYPVPEHRQPICAIRCSTEIRLQSINKQGGTHLLLEGKQRTLTGF
jgi:hypothetical protein